LEGHLIDLDAVLAGGSGKRIILDGFFQRYEYFRAYKKVIQNEWLRMDNRYAVGQNDLSIHIRAGDLWCEDSPAPVHPDYPALPFSYYQKIIEEGKWEKIHIVTESKDDPMVLKLSRLFGAQVRSGSVEEDFCFLRSSKNIVLSVSTFSWWAAWLSEAVRIDLPVAGIWNPEVRPEVDLRVSDEDRYLFHYPAFQRPWRGGQEERDWLLSH